MRLLRLVALSALAVTSCKETCLADPKRGPFPMVEEAALKGKLRTNLDHPTPSPEQRERRKRSRRQVETLKAPFNDFLPVVETAGQTELRPPKEVAERAVAVALAAVKAEGLEQDRINELVKEWNPVFTPEEKRFIDAPEPTERDRAKFGWRYEGLEVLLWSLGLRDELPPPDQLMDPGAAASTVRKLGVAGMLAHGKPRSADELLDMNDLYYCLHWAAIEVRIGGERNPPLNEEIIMERHYALNWLIRYMDQEWDDVTTDT